MTHTLSHWEVSGGDIWPVNGNPRVKIATITKPAVMNGIDWQANANLIAAAPELLRALKMCLNGGYKYKTIEAMAQAAINKAEGVE